MDLISFNLIIGLFYIVKGNPDINANKLPERVVGGMDIPVGQYVPYQVSLQYHTKSGNYQHYCGGSIIDNNLVLTAAHCCYGLNPNRISIRAGIRDLNDQQEKRYEVESCTIHPKYEKFQSSDIAIIKTKTQFELDNITMAAIDVISPKRIGANTRVTLTGWGLRLPIQLPFLPDQWETLNYPTVLQTMTYNTISDEECKYKGIDRLSKTEMCAQGYLLKGACVGDSGGPLVASTDKGLQQVGIVSYGFFVCGVFDVPDVYTRVSEFSGWIQQRIAKNSQQPIFKKYNNKLIY